MTIILLVALFFTRARLGVFFGILSVTIPLLLNLKNRRLGSIIIISLFLLGLMIIASQNTTVQTRLISPIIQRFDYFQIGFGDMIEARYYFLLAYIFHNSFFSYFYMHGFGIGNLPYGDNLFLVMFYELGGFAVLAVTVLVVYFIAYNLKRMNDDELYKYNLLGIIFCFTQAFFGNTHIYTFEYEILFPVIMSLGMYYSSKYFPSSSYISNNTRD